MSSTINPTGSATIGHVTAGQGATDQAPAANYLTRPEGRIAYDDRGSGPLVVLVPGLGDLRGEYRFLVPDLLAAGYRVVSIDLRGHGQSSTGWSDYSSAALGSDVLALVDALGAGPAIVIGTSMGAGAAAWAAAESPAIIAGLVLIGPFVRDVPIPLATRILFNVAVHTAFVGPWAPAAWGAYYTSLYPTRKPADFAEYKAKLVANLREPGRMAALQAMLRLPKNDVGARLGEVRAPTLVVMGTRDPDFPDPKGEAETVAGLLRGATRLIEGAGHYPHAEMPDETVPPILAFVAKHRTA